MDWNRRGIRGGRVVSACGAGDRVRDVGLKRRSPKRLVPLTAPRTKLSLTVDGEPCARSTAPPAYWDRHDIRQQSVL